MMATVCQECVPCKWFDSRSQRNRHVRLEHQAATGVVYGDGRAERIQRSTATAKFHCGRCQYETAEPGGMQRHAKSHGTRKDAGGSGGRSNWTDLGCVYSAEHRVLICKPCGYALQPGHIDNHLRQKHGWKSKDLAWIDAAVSRLDLARPEDIRHRVRGSTAPVPDLAISQGLACNLCDELTPWLVRTGWADHFRGKDIIMIAQASRLPDQDEEALKWMVDAIVTMFDRCVRGLQTTHQETRRWLNSPKKSDPSPKPMGMLRSKATLERYVGYWKRFWCYCLRVVQLDDDGMAGAARRQVFGGADDGSAAALVDAGRAGRRGGRSVA